MKLRPLHDRVIIKRLEEGEQQSGGIIIPDTAKEKPQRGKVIAAGNGKAKADGKRIPLDVKAGDIILFGKYSGQETKLDGEEYLIMKEDEVLAVLDASAKMAKAPAAAKSATRPAPAGAKSVARKAPAALKARPATKSVAAKGKAKKSPAAGRKAAKTKKRR